jgi:acyl carrier protein
LTGSGSLPEAADLRRQIVAYLQTIARPGADFSAVADEANLFDEGLLDSLAVIQGIQFLEQRYGVRFRGSGLDPQELASLSGIMRVCAASRA